MAMYTSDARFLGFEKAMVNAKLPIGDNQIIRVEPGEGSVSLYPITAI